MKRQSGYRVRRFGVIRKILEFFIDSPLTPLIVAASILLGVLAVYLLPREEEPQISVPMIDVFVQMPGASAAEVEQRVTKPVEKLIWELPGVEYIYSTASPGQSLTVIRFLVGWNEERAIVQVNQKLSANFDIIPQGTSPPLVKPRRIDDVPILALTLHGDGYDAFALRSIAAALNDAVKQVKDVSETTIIGGLRRQVRVELDAARLTAYGLDATDVAEHIEEANRQSRTGSIPSHDGEIIVETGGFLHTAAEVGAVVVGVQQGQLVYLRDVARILDGPEEPVDYVLFGHGASAGAGVSPEPGATASPSANGEVRPAVTLAVAKRPGTNAIDVGT
jgi:multidrug efflux pump subunit AcrB